MLSTICWFAMTAAAIAGPYDVTFQVPVNVTRLATAVTKIRVLCQITSQAIRGATTSSGTPTDTVSGTLELPVSAGQVVSPATVVVPVTSLDTSNGRTSASYKCILQGTTTTDPRWYEFFDSGSAGAFRVSPTPDPITGTFTW
jgi:hypothetical protein